MDWYLWLLVAIGSVVHWFLVGAAASFLWSEIDVWGMSPEDKKRSGKRGSRLIFYLGPLGLLVVFILLIGFLVAAFFETAGDILDECRRMIRSSPARAFISLFRWIARI